MRSGRQFADLAWAPEDVHELMPQWTLAQCEDWLYRNEPKFRRALIQAGWDELRYLLEDENHDHQ